MQDLLKLSIRSFLSVNHALIQALLLSHQHLTTNKVEIKITKHLSNRLHLEDWPQFATINLRHDQRKMSNNIPIEPTSPLFSLHCLSTRHVVSLTPNRTWPPLQYLLPYLSPIKLEKSHGAGHAPGEVKNNIHGREGYQKHYLFRVLLRQIILNLIPQRVVVIIFWRRQAYLRIKALWLVGGFIFLFRLCSISRCWRCSEWRGYLWRGLKSRWYWRFGLGGWCWWRGEGASWCWRTKRTLRSGRGGS